MADEFVADEGAARLSSVEKGGEPGELGNGPPGGAAPAPELASSSAPASAAWAAPVEQAAVSVPWARTAAGFGGGRGVPFGEGDGGESDGGAEEADRGGVGGARDRGFGDRSPGRAGGFDFDERVAVGGEADGGGHAAPGAWRERAGLAVRERMPLWLQSRCGLERRSVAALTVLLVVAAVLAAQHFWSGRVQEVKAPEVVQAVAPYGKRAAVATPAPGPASGPVPGGAVAGAVASPGAGAAIVVDVSGKVRNPGIQRLPAGSRVADALRAAGGVRPGTNTDALNRARFLVDGEQVVVGGPAPAVPGPVGAAPGGAASAGPAAPVPLNTATVDQLDTLPGVGPVLAQHIIDYRTQHGGFRSVDELRQVNGIGDRRFADLRNLVRP
ncbi:Soluble ligand binding domain-containing protein [Actinobacteria bacterium OK074]|nr:Soluble ligand binding domain-containing protein [Actinobacteria bacterium OK074]